ncbi:SOS response-associated peptidase [Burkholderiaceae bacterium FT117]|uniref:SOS response-associated peptidase n=1 Tax=Zeimonas sediminis TaxID=2944268 RepID=UPI002342E1AF|nr:SOS response-associated peptidase [Zeimonas sediminis]MCM5569567.1 SOS response-associated peptidase [Zeimonas sediminis]
MCGRYVLYGPDSRLVEAFDIAEMPPFRPRYNVAPQTEVLVVRARPDGSRIAELVRWGLIPAWAKDPAIGLKTINARSETAAAKPAFRAAFRRSRCIVPANGFYEWQAQPGRSRKQPFYIRPARGAFFGFAGLLERWQGPDGAVASCAILTCEANAAMAPVHDRMPCILSADDYARWLDPDRRDADALQALLRPAPDDTLALHPVSPAVGNARNEGPALIEPFAAGEPSPAAAFDASTPPPTDPPR